MLLLSRFRFLSRFTLWISGVIALGCPVSIGSALADETLFYKRAPEGHEKSGDMGYFRIFSATNDESIKLYAGSSETSEVLKQLKTGDIVASAGISRWGGAVSWRKVTYDLTDGWVLQRYLLRARVRVIGKTSLPIAGICRGYDPPWALSWTEDQSQLALFPGRQTLKNQFVTAAEKTDVTLLIASSETLSMEFVSTTQRCALVAGKSLVGTSGFIILTDAQGTSLRAGCCQATTETFDGK